MPTAIYSDCLNIIILNLEAKSKCNISFGIPICSFVQFVCLLVCRLFTRCLTWPCSGGKFDIYLWCKIGLLEHASWGKALLVFVKTSCLLVYGGVCLFVVGFVCLKGDVLYPKRGSRMPMFSLLAILYFCYKIVLFRHATWWKSILAFLKITFLFNF